MASSGRVVSPELCVLLANMGEVVVQQHQLESALLEAVKGDLSALEAASEAQGRGSSGRAKAPHRRGTGGSSSGLSEVSLGDVDLEGGSEDDDEEVRGGGYLFLVNPCHLPS